MQHSYTALSYMDCKICNGSRPLKHLCTGLVAQDCVVSIASSYGLDGLGIKSRWGRDFSQPSRPALGPTQPPIQWVLDLFLKGKAAGVRS
jgi:hypothetical protein